MPSDEIKADEPQTEEPKPAAKETKKKRSDEETDKILKLAQKRFKKSVTAWAANYANGIHKLKFFKGLEHWSEEDKQDRKDAHRPCLVLNEQPKFALQVCGELLKNKVQIKCSPTDDKGSHASANVRAGMIKNIEYCSNAESIYDHANKMAVISGFGAARVLSRYSDDPKDPFKQELYIERIENPFSIHLDPACKDKFFSDGEYCFVDSPMDKDEFIEAFGEDNLPPAKLGGSDGVQDELWWEPEKVWVREYFFKEYTTKTMCQLSDDTIKEKEDADKYIAGLRSAYEAAKADQLARQRQALQPGILNRIKSAFGSLSAPAEQSLDDSSIPTIVKEREVEEPHVRWMKITATKILEENTWPGPLIPVAMLTGEFLNIAGKKYYYGMFENAEDAQKMVDHAYTTLWEIIALQPKTPILASAKMIEGYEKDYLAANKENFPVLKYHPDKDFTGLRPERLQVGQMPDAAFGMFQSCKNDMKDMVGMFNVDLGEKGPETSGVAIIAKQVPGDTAMYTYSDNAAGFVAHIGKILNAALANKYDTARDVRTRGVDGKDAFVPINTTVGKAMEAIKKDPQKYSGMDKNSLKMALRSPKGSAAPFNNITEGNYDVVVSTGPAYQTQRQEAAENILKIAGMAGKLNPADLWHLVNQLDGPGMDAWKRSIAKRVPPGMLEPQEGEPPAQPLPPSPQIQLMMAKIQLEMSKTQVAKVQLQEKILKVRNEIAKNTDEQSTKFLNMLDELFNEHHPADMPPGMAPAGGQEGMQQ